MRRVSLNARMTQDAGSTSEIYVVLLYIMHELLDEPIRLSTDNPFRISDDPLIYATRSTWMGSNPYTEPFLFIIASTLLPDDADDMPASGNIVIENVDGLATLLKSFLTPPTISMAVVLASSPDLIEAEYRDLSINNHHIGNGEVRLDFSREDIENEYYPGDTFAAHSFPGLHR